jgi:hypothetical protein
VFISALAGFLAPIILTGGLNKPFPPSQDLALISRRTQIAMIFIAMALFIAPSVSALVATG